MSSVARPAPLRPSVKPSRRGPTNRAASGAPALLAPAIAAPAVPWPGAPGGDASGSAWATAAEMLRAFLLRRRVPLSIALFSWLVIGDMLAGTKPLDVTNWTDPAALAGLGLVLAGVALRSWAAGVLCKETMLTDTGPYSVVRNPLYIGSFLMMFGFCKLVGDARNALFIVGPMLWLYLLKIRVEERELAERFRGQWEAYVAATPRFFPRRYSSDLWRDWSLAQWLGGREYRAVAGTLIALVALKVWRIL